MSMISIIAYPDIAILAIKQYKHCPTLLTTPLPLCTLVPTKLLDSRCGELCKYAVNLALGGIYSCYKIKHSIAPRPLLHRDLLQ